jgi:hypothetical protein
MPTYISEPEKSLEVRSSCDVLVAGGGIAGIAAAVAATRNGASVTLLEREYALGGMATLGLVTIYLPLDDGDGNQVTFGIAEELLKLSIVHGAEANYPAAWLENGTKEERVKNRYITQFNPHLFAIRAEKLLTDLGVTILYGTLAAAVKLDNGKITHVVAENKSGRSAIAVKSVVDCTGDADICALSGAETAAHYGGNGLASWYYYFSKGKVNLKMFGLADVIPDPDAKKDDTDYNNEMVEALDTSFRFSGFDGEELSRAVIAAHGKMFDDIIKARETDPEYVPVTISSIPLVRMSRRIVGATTQQLTSDRKAIEDSVGMCGDWRKRGPVFELSYRTLYGAQVKNLITAGRTISVTDELWDVTRVIPPCAVTGEAAGTAAAMTDDFTGLDVAELQRKLEEQGVRLHREK